MNTPANDAPGSEETIRKVYVKDLKEKDSIHTVFRVAKKSKLTGRSGKSFVALVLADRTGEIDGRIFDNVDAIEPSFAAGDYVLVKAGIIAFQGKPQVLVEQLERLEPGPIDAQEFAYEAPAAATATPEAKAPAQAAAPREGSGNSVRHIRELVERVSDTNVKALLLAFLDDPVIAEGLPRAPAAKGIHHAYKGGLADHILSVMKLAHRVADQYPMADRDLLLAGALLHDIGKVRELSYDKGGFDYSDEGRLIGHLVLTAQMIREKASRLHNFPRELEQHITHIVLAHHGELEYGSPKVPMTLEALLVHLVDLMDSRVASWLEIMARDSNERWTDVSRLYERHLWKGPAPTQRGRSPVEPKSGGKQRKPDEKRRERPSRKEREHGAREREQGPKRTEPREAKPAGAGLPQELSFKPFSALAPEAPPAPSGEGEDQNSQ